MRIAILSCGDFSVRGGAERLTMDLARALDADIVSPTFDEDIIKTYDRDRDISFVLLNKNLPNEPFKQIVGMYVYKNLDMDYDFYISTDDVSVRYFSRDVPHLYYVFTPRRAMYDMYYSFLNEYHGPRKLFYGSGLSAFRIYDRYFVKKHIKNIACISHTVRNRIYKTYQKDAMVVYPSIHTNTFKYKPAENYWLSVGRVDKWKRIELQVEAFRKLKDKRLYVVGTIYPEYKRLVENAPPNIVFLGNLSENQLIDMYSKCEGFITTAIDEDFGITPVEAMASGKPVVATKEGGYLETVIDGYTGLLVSPVVDEISEAIQRISKNPEYYKEASIVQAHRFDYDIFKKKITGLIKKLYGNE